MASPLTHMAAGYAIFRIARSRFPEWRSGGPVWILGLGIMGAALCADADAILGIIHQDLASYHNQQSHSLCIALLTGGAIGVLGRMLTGVGLGRWLIVGLAGTLSHLVIDVLTIGRGIQFLWPLSETRFTSPLPLFYGLRWSEGLWSTSHLISLATELPIVVGLLWMTHHATRDDEVQNLFKR